jgi:hypothetical protein
LAYLVAILRASWAIWDHLGTNLTPIWDGVGAILAYLDIILRHVGHLAAIFAILDQIEAILGTILRPFRAMLNPNEPSKTKISPRNKNSILIFEP